jgi:2-succinyl-6-hydroxy-2,4-cyclohexadiene-1-carboxylate synthase
MNPAAESSWHPRNGQLFVEERSNDGGGTPQVFLHGFTQTSRSWEPYVALLDESTPMLRVDMPGHGLSTHIRADLPATADLIATQCALGDYIGYSMGGRVALHVALQHPQSVRRLVLISTTAGIANPDKRQRRRSDDAVLADSIAELGVPQFINQWLAQPLFSRLPTSQADVSDRCRNTAEGLGQSLRDSGTGSQESLWERLHELAMPVLLIVGEEDVKFCNIAHEMKNLIGDNARLEIIAEAGHTVHLEQSQQVAELLTDFL